MTPFCLLGNFRRKKYIEDIGKVKRITCSNRRKFKYKKRKQKKTIKAVGAVIEKQKIKNLKEKQRIVIFEINLLINCFSIKPFFNLLGVFLYLDIF